jgi:hypothetical protein
VTGAAKGYRGSIEGRTLVPEQETSISGLVGRAWDDTRRRVPDLTVFTDAQDLVVGFATPGYPCDDVRCAQPRITSNYTGRERFARDDTIDTLRAYGVFFWVPIGPANLPKTLSGSNSPCAIQAALLVPPRRFPPPWSVEEAEACFIVKTDSAGHRHCLQQLQSPRNRYALRKLQKAPHCRVQAAGTEACLKSRSASPDWPFKANDARKVFRGRIGSPVRRND